MNYRIPGSAYLRGLLLFIALSVLAACSTSLTPASVPSSGRLVVSISPDREASFPLQDAVVDGKIYVQFLPHMGPEIAKVRFYLDDPHKISAPLKAESSAPFDLAGGSMEAAEPLDTEELVDGTHLLVAEWTSRNGKSGEIQAEFIVANRPVTATPPVEPPVAGPPDPESPDDMPGTPEDDPPTDIPDEPSEPDDPPTDLPSQPEVPAIEGTLFVAPFGDDAASGSAQAPFATIQQAVDAARPGDVILVRAGVYRPEDAIRITESGTSAKPIILAAYPGERVVVDGSNMLRAKPMVKLTASFWKLQRLEIRSGPYFGVLLMDAEHNILDRLETYNNSHSGVHLGEGASYNLIVDSSSHDNYDPPSGGENADGFAIKHRTAVGNTVLRSAAWNNSDDGFDLLDSPPQRVDRSVAFRNGLRADGTPYPNGNGNGFKLGIGAGRYEPGGGHLVTRSVAWGNEVWGFNSNNGTVPITLYNNTAWDNGEYDFFFHKAAHVLVNNLSYDGKNWTGDDVREEHNSWQLDLGSSPFISTNPGDPRFLWLTPDGNAVNRGKDIGLDYADKAPDLGAIEVGDDSMAVGTGLTFAPDTSADASRR